MLGLKQAELAERAGISKTGLINIESGDADPKASTLTAIQRALESAGIEFIAENGGGAGVRLRKTIPTAPFTIELLMKVVDEFERSKFEEIRAELKPFELSAKLTLERHPAGVNLKRSGASGPIGTIRIVDGTLTFDPELENGRDWTAHDWLTAEELTRWVRETWRNGVLK